MISPVCASFSASDSLDSRSITCKQVSKHIEYNTEKLWTEVEIVLKVTIWEQDLKQTTKMKILSYFSWYKKSWVFAHTFGIY